MRTRLSVDLLEERLQPSFTGMLAIAGGPGTTPQVQVFNSASGFKILDIQPFEPTFTGGVTVAFGDVNGDGFGDLIVGAGAGGGPRVRVFDGFRINLLGNAFTPNNPDSVIADFFAFESSQRGGVTVSAGNFFAGDAFQELVIGAGPGGGPRVRVLNGSQVTLLDQNFTSNGPNDTVADFFAFESSFRNGVNVAATQRIGFGLFSDLAVAPGQGGGPRVRVLSGTAIATRTVAFDGTQTSDVIADFFAYDPNTRSGVFVASADVNGDGFGEIITGPGVGVPPQVRVFNGSTVFTLGNMFTALSPGAVFDQFLATNSNTYDNGVTVGSSPVTAGSDLLLHGIGGDGIVGQAVVSRYGFGAFPTRTPVFTLPLDGVTLAGVNVSN